jgi:hypothetical protein
MRDGIPARIMACPRCGKVSLIILADKICLPCQWKEEKED